MNRKITNITELREEIFLLERRKNALQAALKDDYENIKEELSPLQFFSEVVSKLAGIRIGTGIFTQAGFADEIKSILKQFLVRGGTAFFAKRVYAFAFKSFSRIFRKKRKHNGSI
jgi:hypothetical protein